MMKKKKIFICHSGKTDEQLQRLVTILQESGYEIVLIEENQSEDEVIRIMTESADVLLCIFGDETITPELLEKLIKQAADNDKRIVGTYSPGASGGSGASTGFNTYGDSLPSWDLPKIKRAIEGEQMFESPEGTPRIHRVDQNQGEVC
jgi:ABC-type uncharacterized transport system substrate-binding protein